jgi:hypothetical protein
MPRRLCHSFVATLFIMMALLAAQPAHAQQRFADYTLFTTYSVNQSLTSVSWIVCGSTQQTEGCYASGTLAPFNQACAVLESLPTSTNFTTVTRNIYVLDAGTFAGNVTLSIYRKTDTVSPSNDTVHVTLLAVVPLTNLVGGAGVTCYMAGNPTNVYAATNQSTLAATVNTTTFAAGSAGAFDLNVSGITADGYGYVTITQGTGFPSGFAVYGPDGSFKEDGGGASFMANPFNAVLTLPFVPAGEQSPLPALGYHLK